MNNMGFSRREFVKVFGVSAVSLGLGPMKIFAANKKKPNILLN